MADDLPPALEVDRATIVTMQGMVRGAINTRHVTVSEAGELACGYCYARHPALPAIALNAAVDYVLMRLLRRLQAFTVEWKGRLYPVAPPPPLV